jgi:hypothetical protein
MEDKDQEIIYRKNNHNGYHWRKQFVVVQSKQANGQVTYKLHKKEDDSVGKLCLPMHEIFDAIKNAHVSLLAHLKSNTTHKSIQKKYGNVTFMQCKEFVRLCPVCIKQNPYIKKLKGADKPLFSGHFRDPFQVDLIDMQTRPASNVYDIIMRYIVTVKDHLIGFVCLNCIPRKKPLFVVYELKHLFGVIGHPYIFHTDNGKKFIAREVIRVFEIYQSIHSNCNGASTHPYNKIEEEDRQEGKVHNWNMYLGRIMTAINSMEQRGRNGVYAYEALFGFSLGGSEQFSLQELRNCSTVQERLNLVKCSRFDSVAKMLCSIDANSSNSHFASDKDEDKWSITTTDLVEILSQKSSVRISKQTRTLFDAWHSPSIHHKRKVTSGKSLNLYIQRWSVNVALTRQLW